MALMVDGLYKQLHVRDYRHGTSARIEGIAVVDYNAGNGVAGVVIDFGHKIRIGIVGATGDGEGRCEAGRRSRWAADAVLAVAQAVAAGVDQCVDPLVDRPYLVPVCRIERATAGDHGRS